MLVVLAIIAHTWQIWTRRDRHGAATIIDMGRINGAWHQGSDREQHMAGIDIIINAGGISNESWRTLCDMDWTRHVSGIC